MDNKDIKDTKDIKDDEIHVKKPSKVTLTVNELFKSIQQDTRAILDHISGTEQRITQQTQKALDKIELLDKRVSALEGKAATSVDVERGSNVVKKLGTVIIILIIALVGNIVVAYVHPPTVIMIPEKK